MSDTPDGALAFNHSQLPQSNVAAFNQVGRDLNQTVNVYAGVPLTETLQQMLYHHESATIFANRLESFVDPRSTCDPYRRGYDEQTVFINRQSTYDYSRSNS